MRAAVFRGAFAIQMEQIPDATILAPTDAVVRITHACICGTDLWPYRGQGDRARFILLQPASADPNAWVSAEGPGEQAEGVGAAFMTPVNKVLVDWRHECRPYAFGLLQQNAAQKLPLPFLTPDYWILPEHPA